MIEFTQFNSELRVSVDPLSIVYVEEHASGDGCLLSLPHRAVVVDEDYAEVMRRIEEWYSDRMTGSGGGDFEDDYPEPEVN